MRAPCSECGGRVFTKVYGRLTRCGIESRKDHDLCARCFRSQRNRIVAERCGPKPWFAVRSTLRLLEEQGDT